MLASRGTDASSAMNTRRERPSASASLPRPDPWPDGNLPVKSDPTLGSVQGEVENARSKTAPRFAHASSAGEVAFAEP